MSTREVIGALPLTYSSFQPQNSLSARKRCEKGENAGENFAEETDQAAELTEAGIKELEQGISVLTERLNKAIFELDRIKKRGDNT
jgi:hypothetical protein